MRNTNSTRFAVGVVGNIISGGLFLSPIPTFKQIWKKKDVEALDPRPYLATVWNCLFWCYYGMPFVTPNNILVVTINGAGLIIELVYLAMFYFYASAKGRKRVASCLLMAAVYFAAIVAATMLLIPGHMMLMNRPHRAVVVGIFCYFNVILYSFPPIVINKVVKTKSVKYMPLWLSIVNFMNGCCWTAYALIGKVDYFILISNGFGAILGLVQLIVDAKYWKRSIPTDEDCYEDKCVIYEETATRRRMED